VGFRLLSAAVAAISVILLALVVGIAASGLWLIVAVGAPIDWFLGIVLLLVAFMLRPRLGRLPKYATPVTETAAPTLHRLITEVSTAVGTRRPHTVLVNSAYNASSAQYGLARRRVLVIGLPLWLALTEQQRVALLGHEMAHFVNGDVRRGPLTGLAFSFFETLSWLTTPGGRRPVGSQGAPGFIAVVGESLARVLLGILHGAFAMAQIGLSWLALRATHTAEYAADQLAADVGGSPAAVSLFDRMLMADSVMTMLRRASRNDRDPAAWRTEVRASMDELRARVPRLRQLSMRDEASLFRSHPPSGLRAQMAAARPARSAKVVLTEADGARIDQELAPAYASLRNDLIN
jgi:Zn-dependent protease with chaperone function